MSAPSLQFLLALAAKGTVLLLLTSLAAALAHRARASVRHALWCAGLTGLLLIPVLSAGLPRWQVVSLPIALQPAPRTTPVLPPETPRVPAPAGGMQLLVSGPAAGTQALDSGAMAGTQLAPRFDLVGLIAPVWLSGVGLALAWLLFGHVRVGSLVRAAGIELSPEWRASIEAAWRLEPVGRPVQFRETAGTMPMATGLLTPVVLLPASGSAWSEAHRRDVVIHELAHVRRRDCLTHLIIRTACAVHWFNPLVWVAARQARIAREHACDDLVLAAGALPSSYAQALLDTARQAPAAWATAAAGLTMARPSHLADRLLAVLDERRRRGRLGRMALGAASFGTMALLAPVAALAPARARVPEPIRHSDPTLVIPPASVRSPSTAADRRGGTLPGSSGPTAPATNVAPLTPAQDASPIPCPYNRRGQHKSVRLTGSMTISGMGSTDDGKGNSYLVWTGSDCSVVIYFQGEPTFNPAENDVESFRTSGRTTMTVQERDAERVYDVRGSGSALTRSYRVERVEQPIDDAARKWIGALVLQYIRQSGYQAEARAARILKAQGMSGLLQEITAIQSDYARGRYYRAILPSRRDGGEVSQLLDHAGANVESDYEKGRILAAIPPGLLGEPRVRTSYLAATKGIESDYEKATALLTISAAGLDAASTQTALEAVRSVSSDYERGRVLLAVSKTAPAGRDLDPLYFDAVQGMESSYEKGRVLAAYAQHAGLSEASLGQLYAAAVSMSSANDLSNLLLATLATPGAAASRCDGYLTAAAKIDSDYDKARALTGLFDAGPLSASCARRGPEVAGTISSDNDQARVLIDFVSKGLLTEATRVEFFRSAAGLESSYDRRRVLTAVLAKGPLPEPILASLLDNAAGISSDNDLASLLVAVAGTGQVSAALRPAYLRVAGKLSSDYEKRRALGAIGAQ